MHTLQSGLSGSHQINTDQQVTAVSPYSAKNARNACMSWVLHQHDANMVLMSVVKELSQFLMGFELR